MSLRRSVFALCLAALALPACGSVDADEPAYEQGDRGATVRNGVVLNGVVLNGVVLNGVVLNGVVLNGVVLNGSALSGATADGKKSYFGDGFIGAVFQGLLAGGGTTPVYIDDARVVGDVWTYTASFLDPATNARLPLCGVDAAGAPIEAIGLVGRWDYREGVPGGGSHVDDPSAFTFACRNAALGKCVDLGYKPWASVNGTSLKNHHQACTRMLRADYCGDGRSFTVDGTPINLYDNLGIQKDTLAFPFEAEWVPSGARFIASGDNQRFRQLGGTPPECYSKKVSSTAGQLSHFSDGTLLMNEYQK
ncbi:MAG TPA: ADYC domain-containing protein [Polyangiaceae bacterium]|nr:ADYC domain-containing protein [Polyangiaceae bacterium]